MIASIKDCREWTQERAYELASELYDEEFYDLPTTLQEKVYAQANDEYTDKYADWCDVAYERWKDRKWITSKH